MRPRVATGRSSRPPVPEAERLARVALSRGTEPGDLVSASLLRQLGPQGALTAQCEPKTNSGLHDRLVAVDPARELEHAERLGIRFVVPGDDEWPESLDDLDTPEVQQMGGVPVGLWVRGPRSLTDLDLAVSVVGSRASSAYGDLVAREMASVLARAGVAVVSGGAAGIDRAAHEGALAAEGVTAAVLACGLDRPYPARNFPLFAHLAAEHVVISELPPGMTPTGMRFLARNRLIAALGRATVVVEAATRSGALNTAHWADQLSREVMAVPGPVNSVSSEGVHQRIREGGAALVTHGLEVLEMIGEAGEHLVEVPRGPERPRDRLSTIEQRVMEAVPVTQPALVSDVAREAALHIRDVDAALRRLATGGFVAYTEGGWRQSPAGRRAPRHLG